MIDSTLHQFPPGFLWGTATAAHHVEGGQRNDWSRWEAVPGHIHRDQKAGDACQWWEGRYAEDFDRAAELHNNALRLSIEWSRIEPDAGRFDAAALDQYRTMLKALHARGLKPMVTLHHFTNPLWFADSGGWANPAAVGYFGRYVRYAVERLRDLCDLWCTLNEPLVYATQGYSFGVWPPGMRDRAALASVIVNLARAHAAAYHAIKEVQPAAQVGFTTHVIGLSPAPPALLNRAAVSVVDRSFNRAFPLALRNGVLRLPGSRAVQIPEARGTLDWIGLQYYQWFEVGFDLRAPQSFFLNQRPPRAGLVGPAPWGGIRPEAIFDQIKWLDRALNHTPIYITECGVPDPTDALRQEYLVQTVRAVWRAANFNFPVRGLFVWSLVDNFEWDKGYDPRFSFGLYAVDFKTQVRTARRSASLYAEISEQNGLSAAMVARYTPHLSETLFPGKSKQQIVRSSS